MGGWPLGVLETKKGKRSRASLAYAKIQLFPAETKCLMKDIDIWHASVLSSEIFPPPVSGAVAQVVFVAHVGVGLALQRDVGVCPAFHGQPDKPFGHIPQIEAHDAHFEHLGRVDALMPQEGGCERGALAAEEQPQNVDGIIVLGGQQVVANDSHDGFPSALAVVLFYYSCCPSPSGSEVYGQFLARAQGLFRALVVGRLAVGVDAVFKDDRLCSHLVQP